VDADLETLVTALYVKIDDILVRDRRPGRLSQSELVCPAVAQPMLGFHSEHRWIRFAVRDLGGCSRACLTSPATTSGCAPRCRWPGSQSVTGPRQRLLVRRRLGRRFHPGAMRSAVRRS
jgi:hypothetical protein